MKHAIAMVFKSPNGVDQWELVKPEDVPEWLKEPEVMARLLRDPGLTAQQEGMVIVPDAVKPWYRVERVKSKASDRILAKAAKKRRKEKDRAERDTGPVVLRSDESTITKPTVH